MTALKNETPMEEWPEQAILAYFCSCVEKNLNFTKYFQETRTRLLANLAARLNDSDTPVQAAYTLACMEYARHDSLGQELDPENPTKHMLSFARLFKQHPEDFIVLNSKRTDDLKDNVTNYLARFRNSEQWDHTKLATQALFDFSFAGGAAQLNEAAAKGKKKKIRGKGKNKGAGEAADAPPTASSSSSTPQAPTFSYESTRIRDHCHGNLLLQGLVAPMPGVRDRGSQVEIFDIGDLSAFKVLSLEEPDDMYEDEIKDMLAGDADAMDIDDRVLIIDGADLNLWISKRDGSGM
jgi:hypothetical protein